MIGLLTRGLWPVPVLSLVPGDSLVGEGGRGRGMFTLMWYIGWMFCMQYSTMRRTSFRPL
jgi:hypothetical protein